MMGMYKDLVVLGCGLAFKNPPFSPGGYPRYIVNRVWLSSRMGCDFPPHSLIHAKTMVYPSA